MGSSLLSFLSQVGTGQDELRPLVSFQGEGTHSVKYLSLRAGQGEIPAVRIANAWYTSKRALELYISELGKSERI
jgi:hypothetical protein